MVDVRIPYGKTQINIRIPEGKLLGVIKPKERAGAVDPYSEVKSAMEKPIMTGKLREMAAPGDKVAIVVDDHTRKAPTRIMLPPILEELREAGVKDEDITIIFACGTHRAVKPEEAVKLVGEDVTRRFRLISHNCNAEDLVYVGETSYGTRVSVNRVFAEADLKILTGDVDLHYFAGYGGGRKSVLPGVSSAEAIQHNHAMLLHPKSTTGLLEGNPVHEDMTEAAKLAQVDYILNVVTNSRNELVKAFAGDLEKAFLEGVKVVDELYKVPIERKADIVVVSPGGHPYDIDLYQAYKGMDAALRAVKDGGVLITAAECPEGHGNKVFYEWITKFGSIEEIEREIKQNFVLGGHKAYYLLKALERVEIIMVSAMPERQVRDVFRLKPAKSVDDALREAFEIVGSDAEVWVMTHGNITLPTLKR